MLYNENSEKPELFYDENGAVINTIKVEKGDKPKIYSKPKIYFDAVESGLKPRRIKLWDDNYDWQNLEKLGYCVATKFLNPMERWLPKTRTKTGLFRLKMIPKGWKQIGRIPLYHKLRIDENNWQIQLIGPSVNPVGFSDWYPIMVPEEYKDQEERTRARIARGQYA